MMNSLIYYKFISYTLIFLFYLLCNILKSYFNFDKLCNRRILFIHQALNTHLQLIKNILQLQRDYYHIPGYYFYITIIQINSNQHRNTDRWQWKSNSKAHKTRSAYIPVHISPKTREPATTKKKKFPPRLNYLHPAIGPQLLQRSTPDKTKKQTPRPPYPSLASSTHSRRPIRPHIV